MFAGLSCKDEISVKVSISFKALNKEWQTYFYESYTLKRFLFVLTFYYMWYCYIIKGSGTNCERYKDPGHQREWPFFTIAKCQSILPQQVDKTTWSPSSRGLIDLWLLSINPAILWPFFFYLLGL